MGWGSGAEEEADKLGRGGGGWAGRCGYKYAGLVGTGKAPFFFFSLSSRTWHPPRNQQRARGSDVACG